MENDIINKTENPSTGQIEVITGPMFSGKTEEMLRRIKRAVIAGFQVQVFKPSVDTRYSNNKITSHDKKEFQSTQITKPIEIFEKINNAKLIAIDEAQFFDESIVEICSQLANKGIRVILAGLDMDYKGRPFGAMPQLMAIANHVTKLQAICLNCGNLAFYSYRKNNVEELLLLGEKEAYIPLCRNCFNKEMNTKK